MRAEEALKQVEAEKQTYDAHAGEMREEIEGKLNYQMQVVQEKKRKVAMRDSIAKNLAKIDENERAAEAAKAELMPAYHKALEVCDNSVGALHCDGCPTCSCVYAWQELPNCV